MLNYALIPKRPTAIGNIIAQMLGTDEFESLSKAHESIFGYFDIRKVNI